MGDREPGPQSGADRDLALGETQYPEFASRIYDMFIQTWKDCLRQALAPLPEEHLETLTRDGLCMQLITHGDDLAVLREAETAREMLMAYGGDP